MFCRKFLVQSPVWGVRPRERITQCKETLPMNPYRGTLLKRNHPPLRPYTRPVPRAPWWTQGGGAVAYERGTPVTLIPEAQHRTREKTKQRMEERNHKEKVAMQALTPDQRADYVQSPSRCRSNSAYIRQSGPDSGPYYFRRMIRFRAKREELEGFETIRRRDLTAAQHADYAPSHTRWEVRPSRDVVDLSGLDLHSACRLRTIPVPLSTKPAHIR